MRLIAITCIIIVGVATFCGCPPSMEPVSHDLMFYNNSDRTIICLFKFKALPDSSLNYLLVDAYLPPRTNEYIGTIYELKREEGLVLFIFDYDYFRSRAEGQEGAPETYLEEDRILKRFVMSHAQLDSVGWVLAFP
jgi:hypothetical protein